MSLNWHFTNERIFAALSPEDKEWNDAFVWGCLQVCLGEITEKNAEEWAWRYRYAVELNGPSYYKDRVPFIPSIEEVKKRIGLRTNVSTLSRKQFVAREQKILADTKKRQEESR